MKLQTKIVAIVMVLTLAIGMSLFVHFQTLMINNASQADEQTGRALLFIFLSIMAVVVASMLIIFGLISKFVLARLHLLSVKMNKIAESGATNERVKIGGNDEISMLSNQFNNMLDKISQQDQENKIKSAETNSILESIGDILFVMDKNRVITKVNKSMCEAFKKSPEQLIGKHCYGIVHGTNMPFFGCPAKKTFETKQTVTEEINDPSLGIPLLVTTSPILDAQGEVAQIIHIAKDITKIKLAEIEMQFAANFFEAASDSILVHDLDGRIFFFNQAAHKLRGYSREEFEGLKVSDLEAPGNVWDFRAKIKTLLEQGEGIFETYNLCKDKTIVPFEIHARIVEFDGKNLVLSVARDITERKKVEIKLDENRRRIELMNEKLRVVGSLTRHDVRNKLSAVTGYAYLLRKKHADMVDVVEGLGKMEQAVKDSMRIFEFAKIYEQLGAEELTYIDVAKTINEAVDLLSGFNLKVVSECNGLCVLADSFLRQLFYNFLDNTKKHGEKATTVRVYFENAESGDLKLVYMDDGVGISANNKLKLFSEGFSTGGSTGFGLFLIKKMIEVYNWQIQEIGKPGEGVKFVITIPKLNKNGKNSYSIDPKSARVLSS